MDNTAWRGPIELIVPCHKKMLLVVRMTAMGAASQMGLTLDALDDVKMAVEEAYRAMMFQPRAWESLRISFCPGEGELRVRLTGQGERRDNAAAPEGGDGSMEIMRCILESMTDEVRFERDGEGLTAIEMRKAALA